MVVADTVEVMAAEVMAAEVMEVRFYRPFLRLIKVKIC